MNLLNQQILFQWILLTQNWGGAFDASLKIATGSYVGTGVYGKNNPNTLTFDFEPKILFIQTSELMESTSNDTYNIYFIYGAPRRINYVSSVSSPDEDHSSKIYTMWNVNNVSWYAVGGNNVMVSAKSQLNEQNITYYYIAIGV